MLFAKYIQIEMQIRFSRQCLISRIPWFTNGAPTETHCGPITTPQNSIAGKLLGPILCSPNIIIHQACQPDNLPSLVQGPIVASLTNIVCECQVVGPVSDAGSPWKIHVDTHSRRFRMLTQIWYFGWYARLNESFPTSVTNTIITRRAKHWKVSAVRPQFNVHSLFIFIKYTYTLARGCGPS